MEIYDEDKHDIHGQINSGKSVCIQFSAKWCGPCKRILPEMNELAKKMDHIVFYYVDVDEWEEISGEGDFNIEKLPTFVFYKEGKEVTNRIMGADINGVKIGLTLL